MQQATMALVIAPRRRIARDLEANSGPIFVTIAVLLAYIILSALVVRAIEHWAFWRAAYFTVINVTTVGFGDVTATTQAGKLLSGVNGFVGLVAFGVLVAAITLAFQPQEFRGTASPTNDAPANSKVSEESNPEDGAEAVADLLASLRRLLGAKRHPEKGYVRIAVHDLDEEAHVLVEILVRRMSNREHR